MKTAIFLDIDGVLNEVFEDSQIFKKYEDKLKEENRTELTEEEEEQLYAELDDATYSKEPTEIQYLSEAAIARLKEICDKTGAVVVLNGSQSKPLYNDTYAFWDTYPGYRTQAGNRIMDLFKKYDIPVAGYSYDIERDRHKVMPVLRYMAENKDIDNFIIIEDAYFDIGNDYYKTRWKEELADLMDDRMEKIIDNITGNQETTTIYDYKEITVKGLSDQKKTRQ